MGVSLEVGRAAPFCGRLLEADERQTGTRASFAPEATASSHWRQADGWVSSLLLGTLAYNPSGQRQRNRILDRSCLLRCLGVPDQRDAFDGWYRATLKDLCHRWDETVPRETYWSSAFAVGSLDWLAAIGGDKADIPGTGDRGQGGSRARPYGLHLSEGLG